MEDLLVDEGIGQYVLLGAGSTRSPSAIPSSPGVRGVRDRPARPAGLEAAAAGGPRLRRAATLRLVPVDFEADDDWWPALLDAVFDPRRAAVVSSSGVSMYITKAATVATLRRSPRWRRARSW